MNPIPTDDVPNELGDDISDIDLHDVPAQLENTLKQTFHETKSLFNINIDEAFDTVSGDEDVEGYKEEIKIKQQEWIEYMVKATKKGEQALQNYEATQANRDDLNPIVELKPNAEQQAYLDQAPDFQNFIRGHLQFRKDFNEFMMRHEKMQVLEGRLKQLSQYRLNMIRVNAINRNLAMNRNRAAADRKKPTKRG